MADRDIARLLETDRVLSRPYPTLKVALGKYFAKMPNATGMARPRGSKREDEHPSMPQHVKIHVGQCLSNIGAPPGSELWELLRRYATTSDNATDAYRAIPDTKRKELHAMLRDTGVVRRKMTFARRAWVDLYTGQSCMTGYLRGENDDEGESS